MPATALAVVLALLLSGQDRVGGGAKPRVTSDGLEGCEPGTPVCFASSRDELQRIAEFVKLVSERNRRRFMRWGQRLPSASYELVRRIHPFPYLPYNDTYSIGQLVLTIDDAGDQISVRYRKHPGSRSSREFEAPEFVTYSTGLDKLMRVIDRELLKLAKFKRLPVVMNRRPLPCFQCAVYPPSTTNSAPVTNFASSDAR